MKNDCPFSAQPCVSTKVTLFLIKCKLEYEKCQIFGQGALHNFVDTYIILKEGGLIIFWPSEPEWIYSASAELNYTKTEWIQLTRPENNPQGTPLWTKTSYDPAPGVWMISVVCPFLREKKWAGSVGHDIPISNLIQGINETKIYDDSQKLIIIIQFRLFMARNMPSYPDCHLHKKILANQEGIFYAMKNQS